VIRTASCLYTCTEGARFVIDRHPEHDTVTIVSACSGHGFKHSPAIGEAIARRLTGQAPRAGIDLSPFAFEGRTRPTAPTAPTASTAPWRAPGSCGRRGP
jgi:glycine/D-amino acid oxidase-like deaminating enzyme